jgi:hypothetical protein
MNCISQSYGSSLLVVPIIRTNKKYFTILEDFAREQNIDIVDTRAIYDGDRSYIFAP